MINPDLDFELPPGSFPANEETIRESLPMEVQQWRSLYWARHGLPPRSVAEWMADMPKTEFRFPSEISPVSGKPKSSDENNTKDSNHTNSPGVASSAASTQSMRGLLFASR